ncbi:hypothetical protein RM543_01740 [Roseicyclus sp. F158]|uniref:Uncharacterized protein n=1 Tax=Tropicimonas omnivorans TaxID=3075590 RepID=A0ABU3DCJ5_9RHOB|nr:hypothetical protein [Roseicyclus sp. F158]MDT0681390.1 hypothetical protein [Roseicyclus sp. F158]
MTLTLGASALRAGTWIATLEGDGRSDPPRLTAESAGEALPAPDVTADPGRPGTWEARLAIPAELLSDGVRTIVVRDEETGDMLASFAIVAGAPLDEDLRAEIDLLRAELDMLKGAFRRHCLESTD